MSPRAIRDDDDESLARLLLCEALKPPVAPYRRFVQHVLDTTADALADGSKADVLGVELEYAYAILQDEVSPRDPRAVADALYGVITWAVTTEATGDDLQRKIDLLLAEA